MGVWLVGSQRRPLTWREQHWWIPEKWKGVGSGESFVWWWLRLERERRNLGLEKRKSWMWLWPNPWRILWAWTKGYRCQNDILQSLLSVMQTSERKMGDCRAEEEMWTVLHESRVVLIKLCWLRESVSKRGWEPSKQAWPSLGTDKKCWKRAV